MTSVNESVDGSVDDSVNESEDVSIDISEDELPDLILMCSDIIINIKLLLYKNINYYYIMIKDLIKKNEKHLFVFIILFPLGLGFYKLITSKKKVLPNLTNPISLINLFIILSLILISKHFTDNKRLKKATEAAAISTVIALFAYHDLIFPTFYFVWMLTYFYSTEIIE